MNFQGPGQYFAIQQFQQILDIEGTFIAMLLGPSRFSQGYENAKTKLLTRIIMYILQRRDSRSRCSLHQILLPLIQAFAPGILSQPKWDFNSSCKNEMNRRRFAISSLIHVVELSYMY